MFKYFPETRFSFFHKPMLRFTPSNELNDPFECRSAYNSICSPEALEVYIRFKKTGEKPKGSIRLKDIREEFDDLWDSEDVAASEEKVRHANTANVETFMEKINSGISKIGIISFSATNSCPTMWAHYASEHKGFVIEFDRCHRFFEENAGCDDDGNKIGIPTSGPDDVFYTKDRAEADKYHAAFFRVGFSPPFRKSTSWAYEKELRMVTYDASQFNEDGVVGLTDCPPEAIVGVYLGLKPSEQSINSVKAFCLKYPDVEAQKAYLDNKKYEILFRPLD